MGEKGVLVVFGGEDTQLHIHLFREKNLRKVKSIKSHLSSIRSLTRIASLSENKCAKDVYIVSSGGRAQFKVWKVGITPKGVDLINKDDIMLDTSLPDFLGEFVFCKEMASHMLREESSRSWKKTTPAFDPETRYMDALAFWVKEDQALVILASSDGFIR